MTSLRLLTYNVRSMRDDRAALGRVIRSVSPDVVLVQEAPRFARWRSLCAELARTSNLVVVGGGRPAGSNLILSTLGVDVESVTPLLFSHDPRLHRRGTAIAVLSRRGARFAVAGIHLDLVEEPRLRHVAELQSAIAMHVPAGVPTVIAGDVNDEPGSPTWQALAKDRTDVVAGFSYPSNAPVKTIDGAFIDPRITVTASSVVDHDEIAAASDHRPVLVELDLPDA